VGDVSLLIESASGEAFRSRTITAVCRIKTLSAYLLDKTLLAPARGWQARIKGISLYVQGVDPDRTLGLYNITMGLDLAPPPETKTEAGNE
jgi:hypothetical protein